MPGFAEEHDTGKRRILRLDHPLGFGGDAALDVLSLAVERLELTRRLAAEMHVLAQQQLDRERGVREPTGGVDARTESKRNIDRRDVLSRLESRNFHQRAQTRTLRRLEDAQSVSGKNPIFSEQ